MGRSKLIRHNIISVLAWFYLAYDTDEFYSDSKVYVIVLTNSNNSNNDYLVVIIAIIKVMLSVPINRHY